MCIELYKRTFKEIYEEDGALCARIYLNDLIRGKDITEEQYKEILFGEGKNND